MHLNVPAIRAAGKYAVTYYAADITRYQVTFNIYSNTDSRKNIIVPDEHKIYLQDDPYYTIQDPVISNKRDEILRGIDRLAESVQRIYMFAVGMPYFGPNGERAYDKPRTAITKQYGGCHNHTVTQIALLRGAGIPARYVWNSIGQGTKLGLNHKIAEAHLPGFGWIPLESLGRTRVQAGTVTGYYLVFAVMPGHYNPQICCYPDRLYSYARKERHKLQASSVTEAAYYLLPPPLSPPAAPQK